METSSRKSSDQMNADFLKRLNAFIASGEIKKRARVIKRENPFTIKFGDLVFTIERDADGHHFSLNGSFGSDQFSRTVCFNKEYAQEKEESVTSPVGSKTFVYIGDDADVGHLLAELRQKLLKSW